MLEHKVLYTSDMHGNKSQFKAFIDYAMKIKPSTIIIGGELTPKDLQINLMNSKYIDAQRDFLEKDLPDLIKPLKQSLSNTNVFVTIGNDDCSVNLDVLDAHPELYNPVHNRRLKIDENYEVVGYSFVPITPFGIKDFEKFDLSEISEQVKNNYAHRKKSYNLHGIKTKNENGLKWEKFSFSPEQEARDSIQKDLKNSLFIKNPKKTVYVFHTPPDNTALDVIKEESHVGSFALREFIEKHQPYLTLHGHIHETVDMSGKFIENINNSLSMSAGNHNYDNKVAVLTFDLYNPQSAQRIKLPCGKVGKFFSSLFKK